MNNTPYARDIITDYFQTRIRSAGIQLTDVCHGIANECGRWNNPHEELIDELSKDNSPLFIRAAVAIEKLSNRKNHVPRLLMLSVSELAEAMEGDRKNMMDDHLPHRTALEVEIADAIIRLFDMAGGLGLDVAGSIVEKLAYNTKRADHKLKNRAKENGKDY